MGILSNYHNTRSTYVFHCMNVHVQSQPSTCRNNNTLHTQQLGRVLWRKLSRLVARLCDVSRRKGLIRRTVVRFEGEVVDLSDRGNPACKHKPRVHFTRLASLRRHKACCDTCSVEFVVRTYPLQKR